MKADPTITPSAYAAKDRACSRVDTPKPTQTGRLLTFLILETKSFASIETVSRVPVTPMELAA